jgi:hypothetical protein
MGNSTGLLLISSVAIIIYIIMLVLKKTKVLSLTLHKRILNVALLISFLITAYSGIVFAMQIDYGIRLPMIGNHITWGIIMTLVAIFHAIERRWFFTSMFKKKKISAPEIK